MCTSAPATGFRMPVMARMIATKFSVMENVRFRRMVRIIRLDSAIEMWDLRHLVVRQGNIRRIYGNVAAHTTHGNAHVCLFQSGRIVDAVTDHAHRQLFFLVLFDPVQFILRQALPVHFPECPAVRR